MHGTAAESATPQTDPFGDWARCRCVRNNGPGVVPPRPGGGGGRQVGRGAQPTALVRGRPERPRWATLRWSREQEPPQQGVQRRFAAVRGLLRPRRGRLPRGQHGPGRDVRAGVHRPKPPIAVPFARPPSRLGFLSGREHRDATCRRAAVQVWSPQVRRNASHAALSVPFAGELGPKVPVQRCGPLPKWCAIELLPMDGARYDEHSRRPGRAA